MPLFTAKYTPKNTSQVFGQDTAVAKLRDFVVNYARQKQRAALLYGPVGSGKTCSVHALAKELGYDVLELNSSDMRDEASMKSFLNSALGQRSLFFTPKLVLIDEIDNISGVHDRGCVSALVKAIETSQFPVILTANDLSDAKFKAVVKACLAIEYHPLEYRTIAHGLQWVCEQERIQFEERAISGLARQVDGDMRAALIDLQICSQDGKFVLQRIGQLSDRRRAGVITNALLIILKASSAENALGALDNVDVDLDQVSFWLDENMPREYTSVKALAKAYEALSRADVFQGRIKRRQHWRLLVYINNLLTAGVSSAKEQKNPQFVEYKPTMRFLRMWQAKMKNAKKKEIAGKLAAVTHTSARRAREQLPYLQVIFKKWSNEVREELVK